MFVEQMQWLKERDVQDLSLGVAASGPSTLANLHATSQLASMFAFQCTTPSTVSEPPRDHRSVAAHSSAVRFFKQALDAPMRSKEAAQKTACSHGSAPKQEDTNLSL